jgi:hypothetical protein
MNSKKFYKDPLKWEYHNYKLIKELDESLKEKPKENKNVRKKFQIQIISLFEKNLENCIENQNYIKENKIIIIELEKYKKFIYEDCFKEKFFKDSYNSLESAKSNFMNYLFKRFLGYNNNNKYYIKRILYNILYDILYDEPNLILGDQNNKEVIIHRSEKLFYDLRNIKLKKYINECDKSTKHFKELYNNFIVPTNMNESYEKFDNTIRYIDYIREICIVELEKLIISLNNKLKEQLLLYNEELKKELFLETEKLEKRILLNPKELEEELRYKHKRVEEELRYKYKELEKELRLRYKKTKNKLSLKCEKIKKYFIKSIKKIKSKEEKKEELRYSFDIITTKNNNDITILYINDSNIQICPLLIKFFVDNNSLHDYVLEDFSKHVPKLYFDFKLLISKYKIKYNITTSSSEKLKFLNPDSIYNFLSKIIKYKFNYPDIEITILKTHPKTFTFNYKTCHPYIYSSDIKPEKSSLHIYINSSTLKVDNKDDIEKYFEFIKYHFYLPFNSFKIHYEAYINNKNINLLLTELMKKTMYNYCHNNTHIDVLTKYSCNVKCKSREMIFASPFVYSYSCYGI